MSGAKKLQADALRAKIDALLPKLTDAQLSGLHKIHDHAPWNGLKNCPDEQLASTYDLIQRTLNG